MPKGTPRKPRNTSSKLLLLNKHGMPLLILDIVKTAEQLILLYAGQCTEVDYAEIAQSVIYRLRNRYKQEVKQDKVTVQTMDLEVLIDNIKSGKEPLWENKLVQKNTKKCS